MDNCITIFLATRITTLPAWVFLISVAVFVAGVTTNSKTLYYQVTKQNKWNFAGCTLKVDRLESPSAVNCGALCNLRKSCSFYCIKKSGCALYSARINFNRNTAPAAGSSSSQRCFTSWGHQKDIAHTANITASSPWLPETFGDSAISGFYCYKYTEGCFTSSALYRPFWTADLGESVSLRKIIVQTMRDYPDEFWNIELRIGESPNMTSNALVKFNEGSAPRGAVVTFNFDIPIVGRYVYLRSMSFAYLGICDIQIIRD